MGLGRGGHVPGVRTNLGSFKEEPLQNAACFVCPNCPARPVGPVQWEDAGLLLGDSQPSPLQSSTSRASCSPRSLCPGGLPLWWWWWGCSVMDSVLRCSEGVLTGDAGPLAGLGGSPGMDRLSVALGPARSPRSPDPEQHLL